ncbi:hypothetical protein [Aeromonas popoffii]|uniref:hypothetical protein n=1 Tax=Aeromonas popoffii TaxID=70856 RepID=UPI0030CBC80B
MMIQVLSEWYPDEYDMLCMLAQGDISTFNSFANEHVSQTLHLEGYGLIQSSDSGFFFNLEEVSELLRKKHKHEKINLTDEEKVQEVSLRRNRIEKGLRILIRNSLKISMGTQKAKAAIIASVPEARRTHLQNLDISDLLDRDSSPLFFLELINILKRTWENFSNIFEMEKTKLIVMLEDINNFGRPDAHAKSISSDDFQQLRIYFNKLECVIDDWV